MMIPLLLAAALLGGLLYWTIVKRSNSDRMQHSLDDRRATSIVVSSGEFIDGEKQQAVSLALTDTALYYENTDLEASLDLAWIEGVEYGQDDALGEHIGAATPLTLRCFDRTFLFLLPTADVAKWKSELPPRSLPSADAPSSPSEQSWNAGSTSAG